MNVTVFTDRLDVLGTLAGVFLVIVALGTASGTPWTHSGGIFVTIGQVFGVLVTAAIGAALVYLSHFRT